MSTFAFIPRSISQQKKQKPASHTLPLPLRSEPLSLAASHGGGDVSQTDEEYLFLLELSLSDYALWCNPDLQHRLRREKDGYIPMSHLFWKSPLLASMTKRPSETTLIRCIRSSPGTLLEARMLIAEPSRNEWFDRRPGVAFSAPRQSGGFEIRRKDWEHVLRSLIDGVWTKESWDQRTVYIERIPAPCRSIYSVARYAQSLLLRPDEKVTLKAPTAGIQSITFPRHHLAPPDETPRCKGFVFVVLDSPALLDTLSRSYPWKGPSAIPNIDQEAVRFGMRVLSKESWDILKMEYLAHRQHLLSQAAGEVAAANTRTENWQDSSLVEGGDGSLVENQPREIPSPTSWYPQGCLVFVRNIHPETNKTTLRTLFNTALSSSGGGAVDYVDFNKGIDSCHLRLASPSDTASLVSYFASHSTIQHDALDQVGSVPTKVQPIRIEVEGVHGTREELYWEKVPEKVRKTAVERLSNVKNSSHREEQDGNSRRKRRKKS